MLSLVFVIALALIDSTGVVVSRQRARTYRVVALLFLVGVGFYSLQRAPETARARYLQLIQSDSRGYSVSSRLDAIREGLALSDRPLGYGWGAFDSESSSPLIYPHNFVLEIMVEQGWLVAVFILFVLFLVARKLFRERRRSDVAYILLGLFAYGLINAMVSGDLNANRPLLMVIGLSLCLPRRQAATSIRRSR